MAFPSTNVVGGVEAPKIYNLIEENYVTNGDFEVDTVGWTTGGTGTIARTADSNAPSGAYVLEIADTDAGGDFLAIFSLTPPNGKYVLTCWAKTEEAAKHNVELEITHSGGQDIIVAEVFPNRYTKLTVTTELSRTTITNIRIKTSDVGTDTNTIRVDDVRLYQIDETGDNDIIALKQPNLLTQNYEKILDANYELIGGNTKEFIKGWRYNAELRYDFLEASEQQEMLEISEMPFMLFVPHSDDLEIESDRCSYVWSEYVRWNSGFDFNYFFGRYIAHEITIPFTGIDIMTIKPRVIFSGTL